MRPTFGSRRWTVRAIACRGGDLGPMVSVLINTSNHQKQRIMIHALVPDLAAVTLVYGPSITDVAPTVYVGKPAVLRVRRVSLQCHVNDTCLGRFSGSGNTGPQVRFPGVVQGGTSWDRIQRIT